MDVDPPAFPPTFIMDTGERSSASIIKMDIRFDQPEFNIFNDNRSEPSKDQQFIMVHEMGVQAHKLIGGKFSNYSLALRWSTPALSSSAQESKVNNGTDLPVAGSSFASEITNLESRRRLGKISKRKSRRARKTEMNRLGNLLSATSLVDRKPQFNQSQTFPNGQPPRPDSTRPSDSNKETQYDLYHSAGHDNGLQHNPYQHRTPHQPDHHQPNLLSKPPKLRHKEIWRQATAKKRAQEVTPDMSKTEIEAWENHQKFLEWSNKKGGGFVSTREVFDRIKQEKLTKKIRNSNRKREIMWKFEQLAKQKLLAELNMSQGERGGFAFDQYDLDLKQVSQLAKQLKKEADIRRNEDLQEAKRLKEEERRETQRLNDALLREDRKLKNGQKLTPREKREREFLQKFLESREEQLRGKNPDDREIDEVRDEQQLVTVAQMEGLTEDFGVMKFPDDGEDIGCE